jgi:hypothetical protein
LGIVGRKLLLTEAGTYVRVGGHYGA